MSYETLRMKVEQLIEKAQNSSGGTEELENLIDQSGVLESTDGTATEKVEQLIDYANFKNIIQESLYAHTGTGTGDRITVFADTSVKNVSIFDFSKNKFLMSAFYSSEIEELEVDMTSATNIDSMCYKCANLRTVTIKNMSSKVTSNLGAFYGCTNLKSVGTLDVGGCSRFHSNSSNYMFGGCNALEEIRFVENCIKANITISSPVLSDESIESILKGLAPVETLQRLTIHSSVLERLWGDEFMPLWDEALDKNWEIV